MATRIFLIALAVLAGPSAVRAQNVPDPSETARLHVGALALTPRLGLRNLGVDTNVFNLAEEPHRDLTAIFTAGSDMWLRLGRAYFSGRTTLDWHYFQTASDQRSLNATQEGRVDLDLIRLVPRAGGAIVNTRQRPNEEFDLRVQQKNAVYFGGVMVPIGSRVRLDAEVRRQDYDYSAGEFGDPAVASALNRKSQIAAIQTGFDVTPLTRFVLHTDMRQDRFDFAADRNSDSLRLMPGVELQPSALVSGKAFVGYREFRTPSALVPDVSGMVAAVELRFVAADAFRITGQVSRDLDYSLDLEESVYFSTAMGIEVVQAIGLEWDVVGRLRHAALAYQEVAPAVGRTDRVWIGGVGFGRRIGTEFRAGFDVDYASRSSVREDRAFDGLRFGASVTYGY